MRKKNVCLVGLIKLQSSGSEQHYLVARFVKVRLDIFDIWFMGHSVQMGAYFMFFELIFEKVFCDIILFPFMWVASIWIACVYVPMLAYACVCVCMCAYMSCMHLHLCLGFVVMSTVASQLMIPWLCRLHWTLLAPTRTLHHMSLMSSMAASSLAFLPLSLSLSVINLPEKSTNEL